MSKEEEERVGNVNEERIEEGEIDLFDGLIDDYSRHVDPNTAFSPSFDCLPKAQQMFEVEPTTAR